MKIAIASDHAGYIYKALLKEHLALAKHRVVDFGTDSTESVDYPVFCRAAAEAVASGKCERGIVLGGSGNGEAMAANRILKARCAVVWSAETARLSRQHNNANMISIGERLVSIELAREMVDVWLATAFEGGRHIRRIELLDQP